MSRVSVGGLALAHRMRPRLGGWATLVALTSAIGCWTGPRNRCSGRGDLSSGPILSLADQLGLELLFVGVDVLAVQRDGRIALL